MARQPNHAYEKRQRELAKQARRDEKRARKQAAREAKENGDAPEGEIAEDSSDDETD